jgi:hypothetical protein
LLRTAPGNRHTQSSARALQDANLPLPLESTTYAADKAILQRVLRGSYLPTDVFLPSKNIVYLEYEGEKVLFDTGARLGPR